MEDTGFCHQERDLSFKYTCMVGFIRGWEERSLFYGTQHRWSLTLTSELQHNAVFPNSKLNGMSGTCQVDSCTLSTKQTSFPFSFEDEAETTQGLSMHTSAASQLGGRLELFTPARWCTWNGYMWIYHSFPVLEKVYLLK